MAECTVAIDPGTHGLAYAAFSAEGRLCSTFFVRLHRESEDQYDAVVNLSRVVKAVRDLLPCRDDEPRKVIVEIPQYYANQSARPSDLIRLSAMAGAAAASVPGEGHARFVLPRVWKGSRDKDAFTRFIYDCLDQDELGLVTSPDEEGFRRIDGDILDAVGMGLWSLDRLKRPRHGHEKDGLWQLPDFVR